jgi:hypothetical protein
MTDRWQEFRDALNDPESQAWFAEQDKIFLGEEANSPDWPPPSLYEEFKTQLIAKPQQIVEGLLDVGSRMIFAGGSKTYKTWVMSDLALSVVAGVPWWGFSTYMTPALYVNFELKPYYMQKRLCAIQMAKEVPCGPLYILNLRGFDVTLGAFVQMLTKVIEEHQIKIVFIDPFYKLLAGRDERVSAQINQILAAFDRVNSQTGATIVFAAHFIKGNGSDRESIDRISGGGSINRDPDNLVTLTRHDTEHAFTADFTLRDFAPIAPFVVRWEYPLLVRDDQLDPKQVKRPGAPAVYKATDLLEVIQENDDCLSTTALLEKTKQELGWKDATFYRKLSELKNSQKIFLSKVTKNWNLRNYQNADSKI